MNLNPLKNDNNTDALVKALEDANSASASVNGSAQPAVDGVNPGVADDTASSLAGFPPQDTTTPSEDSPVAPVVATADSPIGSDTNISAASQTTSDENDLPDGFSTDAEAHIVNDGLASEGELDGVKKSALEQLRPLIEKIDLEPADKFDKYLMMLRASDDPTLIKPAFQAAEGITGEKEKAQALLDIINEINYITANQQQNDAA